jgi:hypothetical protein
VSGLSGLSSSEKWFSQFKPEDRDVARMLLDEVHLVSSTAFSDGILKLIDEIASERFEPLRRIALYSERPIKRVFGTIPAFFPRSRHGRAEGTGVPPVVVDPRDQEVGSEGIVAQLVTAYCRAHPDIALSHPGPTKLRKDRVSHIVIVTDLIGSGDRIFTMLESLGNVATIRSWQSYGLIKFVVIAYAATDHGLSRLAYAPLNHEVRSVVSCPTIHSVFRGARRDLVHKLCRNYPPARRSDPFGYRGGGALIAFSHGCPNNAPALLWSTAQSWSPIFPGRTALAAKEAFRVDDDEMLKARTERLLKTKDIRQRLDRPDGQLWQSTMAVLVAAEDGARGPKQISARLGVSFGEARKHFALCKQADWLADNGRPTLLGRMELKRLRRRLRPKPIFPSDDNPFYYPSQLRAP